MKLRKKDISKIGLVLAIISALLYAFNVIIEKKYIESMSSEMILFLMYLGAGLGLFIIHSFTKNSKRINQSKITKKEVPKVVLIVVCELLASFLIIEAVKVVNASLVSLLSIFEIIMTAIVAYLVFKEPIKKLTINASENIQTLFAIVVSKLGNKNSLNLLFNRLYLLSYIL